jgi:hypothetical protein
MNPEDLDRLKQAAPRWVHAGKQLTSELLGTTVDDQDHPGRFAELAKDPAFQLYEGGTEVPAWMGLLEAQLSKLEEPLDADNEQSLIREGKRRRVSRFESLRDGALFRGQSAKVGGCRSWRSSVAMALPARPCPPGRPEARAGPAEEGASRQPQSPAGAATAGVHHVYDRGPTRRC